MLELLKIEWLKIKKYTAFILLSSFYVLGVVASNYIVHEFKKNVVDKVQGSQLLFSGSPYDFDVVWKTVTYYSSFFLMLPALLIVILISNEFGFKTHRQNIIDGWSRMQFLNVKVVSAILIALASTLVVFITGLIFGFASGTSFSLNGFENIGYFLLKAISYNMLAVLISLLTKKSGVAITVFFIYTIFENGISLLLFFWAIELKKDYNFDWGNLGNYLPMNASDGLLTSPFQNFSNMASKFLPTDFNWVVLAFAIAYLILFYSWSKRKMLKSDL
ncbi:MAG: ABC transporter permease subunit [Bacteroidetes bacterium]|nr:ABC transporter permease subunit [Bacteroidota bacterium]